MDSTAHRVGTPHALAWARCTHSVRESVDVVVWSEGGVSKQTPIHKINIPVLFPFHSVLLQCCWLSSTALCVLHCRRSVECVTPFPSCVCGHTPVREHATRSGRGGGVDTTHVRGEWVSTPHPDGWSASVEGKRERRAQDDGMEMRR